MTDFDRIINRHGTNCLKYDGLKESFGCENLIPLWVADMDFESPEFIRKALRQVVDTPTLGYTIEHPRWRQAIVDWEKRRHDWEIRKDWITFIPGIVKGIALAVNFLTEPGDKILIQPPVYHPFRLVTIHNGRECVENPLKVNEEGLFEMDFDQLEQVIDGCKLMIVSNPHNPGGRVWSRETLEHLAKICHRHGVTVISDEIHCDLSFPGHRHHPFAGVCPEAAEISITFGSPSKAFNIPGLMSSWCVIPNETLRRRFFTKLMCTELDMPCLFQESAVVAAYEEGEQWLSDLLSYLNGNMDFVEQYLKENIPAIKPIRPQASFLVWLDCRQLGLEHDKLVDLFVNKAHLALNDGEMFGTGAKGYMRLNVGCPRAILKEALDNLKLAVSNI